MDPIVRQALSALLALALLASCACSRPKKDDERFGSSRAGLSLAPASYPLTLRAPPGVSILEATVSATGGIELGPDATVKRSSGAPAAMVNLGAGGVSLLPKSLAGHVYSQSLVTLKPQAHLLGGIDAMGVALSPGAHVDGPVNTSPNLAPETQTTFSVEFPAANTTDVEVAPHATVTLPAGRYGSILVQPNGKLVLTSGNYYFETIAFKPGSGVALQQFGGPTRFFVRHGSQLSGSMSFSPSYKGFALVQTQGGAIEVSAPLRGAIVAPNANVELDKTAVPHPGCRPRPLGSPQGQSPARSRSAKRAHQRHRSA